MAGTAFVYDPGGRRVYDCRESSNIQSTEEKTHSGKCVHHILIEMNLAFDLNRFEILQEDRPPRRRARSRPMRRARPAALHRNGRKRRPTPTRRRRRRRGLAVVATIVC